MDINDPERGPAPDSLFHLTFASIAFKESVGLYQMRFIRMPSVTNPSWLLLRQITVLHLLVPHTPGYALVQKMMISPMAASSSCSGFRLHIGNIVEKSIIIVPLCLFLPARLPVPA
ncbi:hypothetical protein ACNKHN_08460 [Shigella flexneri]